MKEDRKNISLENERMKDNPFTVPDSYFTDFAQNINSKITCQDEGITEPVSFILRLKPALMLAMTFCIIALLGYAVSGITERFENSFPEGEGIMALIEYGELKSDFIDTYYSEIDITGSIEKMLKEEMTSNSNFAENMANSITYNDIYEFLETDNWL